MKPFLITVDSGLKLMIVPDSDAHADGHPVLTYSYSIYKSKQADIYEPADSDTLLLAEKRVNPDYRGTIIFEQPDKLFNYVDDGPERISPMEVQEAIEQITAYRDNPAIWRL